MSRVNILTCLVGFAVAAGVPSVAPAQQNPDAAGVAAAIRFQKAEQAAAARQARVEAERGHPAVTPARANGSDEAGVAAAIRFERAEDAAAARQARIEAGRNLTNSARLRPLRQERP